jgi:beta-glucanase (GH16 family)
MPRHYQLIFAICAAVAVHAEEPINPPRDPAYKLVWSDEFEKDGAPDPSKWRSESGFERNQELQWYQGENVRCAGGLLIIEGRREQVTNPHFIEGSDDWKKNRRHAEYTSGSLVTFGKNAWCFGRYEVRARFKALPGLWPAIWTTGRGRWPHGGEIDLMEFYDEKILANFVWAGKYGHDHWNASQHPISQFNKETWDETFHVWVMEWNHQEISLYLNGKLLNKLHVESAINQDGPKINPFLSPHHFRLNLAIGGAGGDPSGTTFPQRYEVDYVRIYQR